MKINKEKMAELERLVESVNAVSNDKDILVLEENKLKGDRRYVAYVLDTLGLGKTKKESKNGNKFEPITYTEDIATYTLTKTSRGDYFLSRAIYEEELDRTTTKVLILRRSTTKKLNSVENKTENTVKAIVRQIQKERRGFGL